MPEMSVVGVWKLKFRMLSALRDKPPFDYERLYPGTTLDTALEQAQLANPEHTIAKLISAENIGLLVLFTQGPIMLAQQPDQKQTEDWGQRIAPEAR